MYLLVVRNSILCNACNVRRRCEPLAGLFRANEEDLPSERGAASAPADSEVARTWIPAFAASFCFTAAMVSSRSTARVVVDLSNLTTVIS